MLPKVFIAIPTYNEAKNIGQLLEDIFAHFPGVSVLVVDDGSPDNTALVVREKMRKFKNIYLFERSGKLGFASAYLIAFREIISRKDADFLITMDADFSHNPSYLSTLISAVETCDMVIGSRYTKRGGVKNWSLVRRILSRVGNFYARIVTGLPLKDMTAGFLCLRVSFLKKIPWQDMRAEGYAWLMELKVLFYRRQARIFEIPIIFEERRFGLSKISRRIVAEGIIYPWFLRFLRR